MDMKKRYRQWMAVLLLGVMLLLEGCTGRGNAGAGPDSGQGMSSEYAANGQSREKSMGRYLEEEVSLPQEITSLSNHPTAYLRQLDNGDLALIEKNAGLYLSSDHGETWTKQQMPWYDELAADAYISEIALAPDGAVAMIYSTYRSSGEETEPEEASDFEYTPEYLYVDPEGNAKNLHAPDSDPKAWVTRFWFGQDSRLYAFDINGKAYEIDTENGDAEKLFAFEGVEEYTCFTGRYMMTVTSRNDMVLYDLDSRMVAEEDSVLREFIRNNVGNSIRSDTDAYPLAAAAGEQEDVLYLAYSGGVYRHVIGGSVMEQLSDGNLNSLGDPQMQLFGFAVLPENEFLILYNKARLYRYVYNPDIPSVPEEQIRIYSLAENYTIRQAVSLFQKQHPEVYVNYETGLSADTGMTTEDAVKNLNTKLMSGTGPDLLVLDGLPLRSYEEKGALADLSGIVHIMNESDRLFKNLTDACRLEGKLYYLPVHFRLPLLTGDRKSVEQVNDLASLADAVEALRRENPEGALIGLRTEEEVLHTLKLTSAAAWVDPVSRTIDQEKLTEFLQSARRIYQAETAGISEEELADYRENHREVWQSDVTGEGMYYAVASANAIDVAMGTQKLGAGITYGVDCEFNVVTTLANQEEDFAYVSWQGQVSNGFIPKDMVGICAGSEKKEMVLEFFRFLYGSEFQEMDLPAGYPVNEACFEKRRENPRTGFDLAQAGIVLTDGLDSVFSLDVVWSPEEDFDRLQDMVRSASAICTGDAIVEEIVCELGVKAVNGSAGVEETVAEIVKKAAIYLAE